MLNMEVNGTAIQIELIPGSASRALEELLRGGPLTLPMKDYAHMEKFGDLGRKLPCNDRHITAQPGDLILSEGSLLVIYYAPNTWNFTRLGRVANMTGTELKKVLGKGTITATFTINREQEETPK